MGAAEDVQGRRGPALMELTVWWERQVLTTQMSVSLHVGVRLNKTSLEVVAGIKRVTELKRQRLRRNEPTDTYKKLFQAEGTVYMEALGQQRAWHLQEVSSRPTPCPPTERLTW